MAPRKMTLTGNSTCERPVEDEDQVHQRVVPRARRRRPRGRRSGRGRHGRPGRRRGRRSGRCPARGSTRWWPATRAMFTDCSTSTIVVPPALSVADGLEQPLDHHGGEAERELVDQQHAGLEHEGPAEGEHLLLAARQRAGRLLRAGRGARGTARAPRSSRSATSARLRRKVHAPARRFSSTVSDGNVGPAAGHLHEARRPRACPWSDG